MGRPSALDEAGTIPGGRSFEALTAAASEHGVHVCAGIAERASEQLYNAAFLVDGNGRLLLHHRKLNELDIARDLYETGDRLGVVKTPHGTIGLMICADAFADGQTISRSLGYMGADFILSPAAWAVPPDHDNAREPYGEFWRNVYGEVCRDFRIWILGVSSVMAKTPKRSSGSS
jgi:predicted amidohydrolase